MEVYLKHLVLSFFLALMAIPVFSQAPLNWTRDEINPGEDFTLSIDEAKYTEGQRSCHMQLHTNAVPYLVSDVYYIIPGEDYEFTIDVFDNDTSGQVKVYADFYDAYGFDVFGQAPVFSADSSDWQTIAWEGTVPEMAVVGYVLIKFYCQPDLNTFNKTADIWIDNVQFRINGDTNLVLNGGFENWTLGVDESAVKPDALIISPNPARHYVNITMPKEIKKIILSDITGKIVMAKNANENKVKINVSELSRGMYFIRANSDSGFTRSEILILN